MYIDLSTLSDYSNSLTSEKNNIDCKLSSIIQNYGITNIDNLFSRMCSKIKHDSENYITRYNNIVNNLNKYVSDVGTIEQALMQNNGVVHTNEESVNIFFNNNMAPLRTMVDLQNGKNINYGKLGKYTYGSIGFHSLTSNINIQKKQNEEEIETSPEVSKEELQEMRNILGNVSENVDDETLSYVYASYQLIKANEEAIKKAGYTLKECLESDIAQAQRGFEISEIIKKRQHFIKTLDYGILETWMDITGTTGAQVATLTLGLTEGIVNFGENVYDAAVMGTTMALSGCLSVLGANELAGDLLKNNAEFIGYDASTNMFNYIYDETNFGDTIKEYNSNYQVMRQVSKQIGEVITTIGVGTFCPLVTIPATAAISGFGSGMEEAYSNGASVEQGLLCGAINGGINFIAFKVGQAINNSALFKTVTTEAGKEIVTISSKQAVANAVSHIFMDTADGFAESFLSPLVQMTYQNTYIDENGIEQEYSSNFWEKYSQIYENLGGLESSLSQALIGGTMSAVSEISGIAKALRNKDNIEVKNVTDIKEKVSVPQKVKNKLDNLVDNYKKELFLAKNIDEMAELTEDNITKLLGKKVSNSKAILGVICSPFSYITKTISSKLEGKELLHAIDNGIYHFSRIENCEKILESGYVKGSKPGLISYGKSKSYFFNGVPSIEKYAMNIQNIHYKTTAVKLSLDADTLSNFRYRNLNDGALTFNGDFNFNKENAKIVYFILENTENGLAYKEVTKEVWESTKNVFDNKTISDSLKKSVIKTESVSIAMSDEFDMLCNNLKKLKNSVLDKGKTFSGNVIAVKEKTKNVIERLKNFSLTDNGHIDIDAFNLKEKINKIVLEKNKKFSGKLESSISNANHSTANKNLIEVSPMHIKNLESTARHTDWYLSSLDEEKSILFYADSLDEVPKGFFEKFKNPTNKYIKVDGKIYGFNSIDNLNVLKDAAGNDIFIFNSLDEIPEEIFMLANSNSALMINGYTYQLSQYNNLQEFLNSYHQSNLLSQYELKMKKDKVDSQMIDLINQVNKNLSSEIYFSSPKEIPKNLFDYLINKDYCTINIDGLRWSLAGIDDIKGIFNYYDAYCKKIKPNVSFDKQLTKYNNSSAQKYGINQGNLNDLYYYDVNGIKYTSRQYESMLKEGYIPTPDIDMKIGTERYFEIKDKIISKGFTPQEASQIIAGLDSVGACSYAATSSEFIRQYINDPTAFENFFGYPMYVLTNGKLRLNEEELLLDIYMFCNDKVNGGMLFDSSASYGNKIISINNQTNIEGCSYSWLNAENQKYLQTSDGVNEDIIDMFIKSKNSKYSYNTEQICSCSDMQITDAQMNDIANKVSQQLAEGKGITLGILQSSNSEIRFIPFDSDNYDSFYTTTNTWNEGEGHAVCITGVTKKGFIISSWGRKYLIEYNDLKNNGRFLISASSIGER